MVTTPRRWFRFHLTTALLISFVSGCFVLVNCKPRYFADNDPTNDIRAASYCFYGWPWPFYAQSNFLEGDHLEGYSFNESFDGTHTYWKELGCSMGLALSVTIASGVICEYLIRRHETRKP